MIYSESAGAKEIRIAMVDDHPSFRLGLATLIRDQPGLTMLWESDNVQESQESIRQRRPDLVVVDISLKGSDGLELIKWIKARYPSLPTLALSVHSELVYAERALRAGARGYVMKTEPPETLLSAVYQVLRGDLYVSERLKTRYLNRLMGQANNGAHPMLVRDLTDRELEIFRLIGRGWSTPGIAEELQLSIKTIETYRAKIRSKLGVRGSEELFLQAFVWNEREGG